MDVEERRGDSKLAKLNWHEFNDQSDKINALSCYQFYRVKEEWRTALSDLTNFLRMRLIITSKGRTALKEIKC